MTGYTELKKNPWINYRKLYKLKLKIRLGYLKNGVIFKYLLNEWNILPYYAVFQDKLQNLINK